MVKTPSTTSGRAAGILAHGEFLVHDLSGGQVWPNPVQASQLGLPILGAHVAEDQGSEWIEEDRAARGGREPQLARRALGFGIVGRHLLEGQVLDEGSGEERVERIAHAREDSLGRTKVL